MNKKEFEGQTFRDYKGYLRWKDSNGLVHRSIAYKKIYLKNRKKYPLEFKDYQVHHKNRDITNNRVENLELKERKEHEKKHGIVRREQLNLIYIKIMAIGFLGILGVEELSKRLGITGIRKALMFMGVFIITLILALWFSREREGVKYV